MADRDNPLQRTTPKMSIQVGDSKVEKNNLHLCAHAHHNQATAGYWAKGVEVLPMGFPPSHSDLVSPKMSARHASRFFVACF